MFGILASSAVMCMAFLGLRESYILLGQVIEALDDTAWVIIVFLWPLSLSYFHIIIWAIGFMHFSDSIAAIGVSEGWHACIVVIAWILFEGLLIWWATE